MVKTFKKRESGVFYSNNKNYRKMQKKVSLLDPELGAEMSASRPEIFGISPYGRHGDTRKASFIQQTLKNPFFVLRELLRENVGAIKQYKKISEREYLALLSANRGDSVLVSTPVQTLITDLIAYFILMRQPEHVFLTSGDAFEEGVEKISRAINRLSALMPSYLKFGLPMFHQIEKEFSVAPWASLDPRKCVIILHEYEHDNLLWGWDAVNYERIEKYRDYDDYQIPLLGVSSFNSYSEEAMKRVLKKYRELTLSNLTISCRKYLEIDVDDLLYLKTDSAKVKYYKRLIEDYVDMKYRLTRHI